MTPGDTTGPRLRRDLGLTVFTLYGAGNIIGAGIYVLVGKVAGEAGAFAPLAFVLAAVVAGLTGLSFGELGARFPVSAGEAVFVHKGFNRRSLSIAIGCLIAIAGLVSAATMAHGFVGYFGEFIDVPAALTIIVLLSTLTLIAARGIAESARVAAALTLVEAGGLLWIIAVALPGDGATASLPPPELLPPVDFAWQGILGGAFLAFFAFIGFEDMVNVAEEVHQPQRTIPRGILLAFGLSTVLYLLVCFASLNTLSPAQLAASDAPLADVYRVATGHSATVISLIGLVAVINGGLIQVIKASRVFYGMSCNRWLPAFFSVVNPRTRTPLRATFFAGGLALFFALALPLVSLAKLTSGVVLLVFTCVNLALVRIKGRDPVPEGVRPVPLAVPVCGAVASLAILVIELL